MGQAERPLSLSSNQKTLRRCLSPGGHVEAIDTQTVRIVAWVDRPNNQLAQNSSSRGCAAKCGYRDEYEMQKAIVQVIGELKHSIKESHEYDAPFTVLERQKDRIEPSAPKRVALNQH